MARLNPRHQQPPTPTEGDDDWRPPARMRALATEDGTVFWPRDKSGRYVPRSKLAGRFREYIERLEAREESDHAG